MKKNQIINYLRKLPNKYTLTSYSALCLYDIIEECNIIEIDSLDIIDPNIKINKKENKNINYIEGVPTLKLDDLINYFKEKNDQKTLNIISKYLNRNSLVLAYLGDSIYEVYIRKYLINKYSKVDILNKEAKKYVSAKGQSYYLNKLLEDNFLTDEEKTIIKRGRNHRSHSSKSTDIITYKNSTGFEALIGYLDLKKEQERIEEIINYIVGD